MVYMFTDVTHFLLIIATIKLNENISVKNYQEGQVFERNSLIGGKSGALPNSLNNDSAETVFPLGTSALVIASSSFCSTRIPNSLAKAKIFSSLDLLFDFKVSSILNKDSHHGLNIQNSEQRNDEIGYACWSYTLTH